MNGYHKLSLNYSLYSTIDIPYGAVSDYNKCLPDIGEAITPWGFHHLHRFDDYCIIDDPISWIMGSLLTEPVT